MTEILTEILLTVGYAIYGAIWGVLLWKSRIPRKRPGLSAMAMRNFTRNYMTVPLHADHKRV